MLENDGSGSHWHGFGTELFIKHYENKILNNVPLCMVFTCWQSGHVHWINIEIICTDINLQHCAEVGLHLFPAFFNFTFFEALVAFGKYEKNWDLHKRPKKSN